jgi:hypothetical protein
VIVAPVLEVDVRELLPVLVVDDEAGPCRSAALRVSQERLPSDPSVMNSSQPQYVRMIWRAIAHFSRYRSTW